MLNHGWRNIDAKDLFEMASERNGEPANAAADLEADPRRNFMNLQKREELALDGACAAAPEFRGVRGR